MCCYVYLTELKDKVASSFWGELKMSVTVWEMCWYFIWPQGLDDLNYSRLGYRLTFLHLIFIEWANQHSNARIQTCLHFYPWASSILVRKKKMNTGRAGAKHKTPWLKCASSTQITIWVLQSRKWRYATVIKSNTCLALRMLVCLPKNTFFFKDKMGNIYKYMQFSFMLKTLIRSNHSLFAVAICPIKAGHELCKLFLFLIS